MTSPAVYFLVDLASSSSRQFSNPVKPFNTGDWYLRINADTSSSRVIIECSDVDGAASIVKAERAKLTVVDDHGEVFTAETVGFPNEDYPPHVGTWDLTCEVAPQAELGEGSVWFEVESSSQATRLAPLKPNPSALLYDLAAPNDVVFYFPRSNRELWANSTLLKRASAHFKASFESDFKEGSASAEPFEATQPAAGREHEVSQDSDDETDTIPLNLAATRTKATLPAGVREVVIDPAAYTTYRAVLLWMYVGRISFAPLTRPPGDHPQLPDGSSTPHARLRHQAALEPLALLPASPKSVYLLADYLDMPQLAALALDDFKSKLTAENVLFQMTTTIAVHEPVRAALVEFAIAHWAEVRKDPTANLLSDPDALEGLANPLAAAATLFKLVLGTKRLGEGGGDWGGWSKEETGTRNLQGEGKV